MPKKNDMSGIKDVGLGILDTLEGIKEGDNKNVKEEKSNAVNINRNKSANEELHTDNRGVETFNSKMPKGQKSKRSFMLTDTAIQKLNLLKLCMGDKDLSTIVEESITMYFDENKKSIDDLIDIYNKIK